MHDFLESEGVHDSLESEGDTWQDRKGFLQPLLVVIKELEEQQNLGETQDTIDVRTTLDLQQNTMDIQEGAEGTGNGDG